ncbi:MAG: carboxypeptidase M32 [Tumebacillaceae bacterium]
MTTLTVEQAVPQFQALVKKIKQLQEVLFLMGWDMRTGAPGKGIEERSEALGMISTEQFKLSVSDEMGQLLDLLSTPEATAVLDDVTRVSVRECKKEYDRNKKIPAEKFEQFVVLCSKAEHAWQSAKANNDFDTFAPFLEQIVDFNNEFIELWGYGEHKYNTLLDKYEPGLTVKKVDKIFAPLRERTVQLLKEIGQVERPNDSFLYVAYDKAKQRQFSEFILKEIGFDFEAGRLDVSEHPFAAGLNTGDVRLTTRFDEDILYSLFSSIHEGGHGMYEQNIGPELKGTLLSTGASMGVHESQSRFWENMIGRSREFWDRYYSDLQALFPENLANVSVDEFYKAINLVEPSLIRTEADELTYNLHIMIRYEIEKGLFSGEYKVRDLPRIWNEKMADYVGVVPESHSKGVLQDIHWSGGDFGYFVSYSLGNIYAAQLENALRKEIPDYKDRVKAGDLSEVKAWMNEKVYKWGMLKTPGEIMTAATGEEINADYLVRYLEEKYRAVYGI